MTVMIDAEYVLKIIGDQLYGEMSAGDEYLYDHKTYDDGLEWCFELIRNVANNTAPGLHAGGAGTMNWISVKDRLPESGIDVLVFTDDYCAYTAHYDGYWWLSGEPTLSYNVTHWMPLPAPPEDGKR